VPEIFLLLVSYFEVQPDLMKTEGLFRIAASLDKLDELQVHVTMGNYYYLTLLKEEPHVVANYLKKVLKYMGEPLCTFALYSRFRDLSDTPVPKRAAKLKEICALLPPVNRNVFIFIIKFFLKVTKQSEHNKMNVHNLATVVTPNIFRPFELTANDLIFAQHLVETFKIMITEYREVFSVTPEEEEGEGEDEEILVISPYTNVASPKIVEEDLVGQVFQSQRRKSQNEDSGG
jgi:hypothetical protein